MLGRRYAQKGKKMPTMHDIYQNHSFDYDELVSHEDYENNLGKWLKSNIDLNNKVVIEYGVGTGRLTKLYIESIKKVYCFDRSSHMIDRCKNNLEKYKDKIEYGILENDKAPQFTNKFDILIEGWSFGHTVIENKDKMEQCIKTIMDNSISILNDNGKLFIIETLGSNVEEAKAPTQNLQKFYSILENEYGFTREIIRTDYKFANTDEAYRIFNFFFGNDIANSIKNKNSSIVKEFTGIWYKNKS
jgi:ubiquinone/menaquinone biosynthesis C-methylase UbiE